MTPATLELPYDDWCVSNLLTVVDALNTNVCQTVGLKVKIVTKSEKKQVNIQNVKIKYKVDSITADETQSMKLVLWHNQQSKQQAKATSWNILQYAPLMILNLWIRRNQFSVIHEVDDIDNINIDNPELKENILTGQYIGVDINETACCMVCNKSLPTEALDDEMITCNNCKITPLSLLKCPRL